MNLAYTVIKRQVLYYKKVTNLKVFMFYLAFLIIFISFVPYALTSCLTKDNNLIIGDDIAVYDHVSNKTYKMKLENYIVGVVCAEMPASFSVEAIKAQSVAARTYAFYKKKDKATHNGADVCTDFSHCQAFLSEDELKKKWGKGYDTNFKKLQNAVYDTSGEYLVYKSTPAMTVFHSCSNGITEKASDVWSSELPYLTNVKSPGEEMYKNYFSQVRFDYNEFVTILETNLETRIDTNYLPVGDVQKTSGDNILSICLFGNNIKGTDVRKMFSLKSTAFTLDYSDGYFTFNVYGNGHGVGMSQYGAEAMAKNGASYDEILKHYYPGTEFTKLNK